MITNLIGVGYLLESPRTQIVSPYIPQAQAYFARIPAQSDPMYAAYNALFVDGVVNGWLSRVDYLYLLDALDTATLSQNLVSASYPLTLVNSPAFVQYRGLQGDGASSYWRNGFVPSNPANIMKQNDVHIGFESRTNIDAAMIDMGSRETSTTQQLLLLARFGGVATARMNVGATSVAAGKPTSIGHYIGNRVDAANQMMYVDGGLFASGAAVSSAFNNMETFFGAVDTAGVATGFTTRQYKSNHGGGGLTSTQAAQLSAALSAFHAVTGA